MTDFAALIDRVIANDIRSQLEIFLKEYQFTEAGRTRRLVPHEAALITDAVDAFLLGDSMAAVVSPEITDVCNRLSRVAEREELGDDEEGILIRNACFDAMACIKVLRARLIRQADQAAIQRSRSQSGEGTSIAARGN